MSKPYYNAFKSIGIGHSRKGMSKPYSSAFKSAAIYITHIREGVNPITTLLNALG